MIITSTLLPSAWLFTNTVVFSPCITNGTTIVKDSVYASTSFNTVLATAPVRDSFGQLCTTITNSGAYATVSSLGWGYQQSVVISNDPTILGFISFVSNSLAFNTVSNLEAHTNGLTPSSEAMFTTIDPVNTNYVVNPSCWLKDYAELSAIVIANGNSYQIGGSAVSPRHVINCAHAPFNAGTVLTFIDTNSVVVQRSVLANTNFGLNPTDLNVCILNADLPPSVVFFKVLPTNYASYIPSLTNNHNRVLGVACNQLKQLFPKLEARDTSLGLSAVDDTMWLNSSWNVTVVTGDSGHPIMLPVGTHLALLGHWTYGGVFAGCNSSYADRATLINSAMHYLSTNNSAATDYQLTPMDLSSYPTF